MVPADSRRISRDPRYSGSRYGKVSLRIRSFHALRLYFPIHSARYTSSDFAVLLPRTRRNGYGLGSSPFARHYRGNHSYFLFLRLLRCFSSPRSLPDLSGCQSFRLTGCPIRRSADQRLFAPPRSFSQLIASFFASESLGIRHAPFFCFFRLSRQAF